ncbi:hypothetical protein TNIN_492911 [Trichonephila inaurata madagascariensis]|uniref:Uncharacterized protein n=1 Tax=Trichonephila inaurata madagascariensis TaxID=2747483 RepID=A0A8X6XBT4_9ARAC|nr:hypothetical protein TNIN_492911 [Trichonephila inaurata madagascariensis]
MLCGYGLENYILSIEMLVQAIKSKSALQILLHSQQCEPTSSSLHPDPALHWKKSPKLVPNINKNGNNSPMICCRKFKRK